MTGGIGTIVYDAGYHSEENIRPHRAAPLLPARPGRRHRRNLQHALQQGEAEAIAVREEGRSLPRSRSSGVKDGQRPRALPHVPERLMAADGSAGRASAEDDGCRVSLACLGYPAHAGLVPGVVRIDRRPEARC